jgi:hypothetical protein
MDDHFCLDLEAGRLKIEAAKSAAKKGAESSAEIGEVRFVQQVDQPANSGFPSAERA